MDIQYDDDKLVRFPQDWAGNYSIPSGKCVGAGAFQGCKINELVVSEGVVGLAPSSFGNARFETVTFLLDGFELTDWQTADAGQGHLSDIFCGPKKPGGFWAGWEPDAEVGEIRYLGTDANFVKEINWGFEFPVVTAPNIAIEELGAKLKIPAALGYAKAISEGIAVPESNCPGYEKAIQSSRKKLFGMASEYPFIASHILKRGYLSPKEAQSLSSLVEGDVELVARLLEYSQAKGNSKPPSKKPSTAGDQFETSEVEGGVSITKINGRAPKNLVIPSEIDGKPVVEIARGAFKGKRIEKVELPDGLRVIGQSAFAQCNDLASVEIPASVEVISSNAFSSTRLHEINIPEDSRLSEIGSKAFDGCFFERISIPATVRKLGKKVFGEFHDCEIHFAGGAKIYDFDYSNRRSVVVLDAVTDFKSFTRPKEKLAVATGYVALAERGLIDDVPEPAKQYVRSHGAQILTTIYSSYWAARSNGDELPDRMVSWMFSHGYAAAKDIEKAKDLMESEEQASKLEDYLLPLSQRGL